MNWLHPPGTCFGLKVIVQPDVPRLQLGRAPCRLPDGTEIEWITPTARADTDAWLLRMFGTTNVLKDGDYLLSKEMGFVSMNPRTLVQFQRTLNETYAAGVGASDTCATVSGQEHQNEALHTDRRPAPRGGAGSRGITDQGHPVVSDGGGPRRTVEVVGIPREDLGDAGRLDGKGRSLHGCEHSDGRGSQPADRGPHPAAEVTSLLPRIDAAIERITSGRAPMRIPAENTDPDLVLADCKRLLSHAYGVQGADDGR
jgi:hypothetical protein